jgi:hypothetical protein
MAEPKYGLFGSVEISINGVDIPYIAVESFEWASSINAGYMVQATISDPNHVLFELIVRGAAEGAVVDYLKHGRQKPVKIEWRLLQAGTDKKTEKRLGYLLNLNARGAGLRAAFSFVGQDPPTFLLNAGVADGRVYRGKIGGKQGVISKCVKDFTKAKGETTSVISVDVTETSDNEHGVWPMFRMDPKSYIRSLLDWSSALTKDKESRWIISCKDTKINIKKAADLTGRDLGVFDISAPGYDDVLEWRCAMNNFMTLYQGRLVTSAISATTGAEVDKVVRDENTDKKVNVFRGGEGSDRAFTKPKGDVDWPVDLPATFVRSVPEHSGGEVYRKYADYMDGRARQIFDDMLTQVMRMRILVPGEPTMDDSDLLGVSTCTLNWPRSSVADDPYFAHGRWIVDGFHHVLKRGGGKSRNMWQTYLHMYRLDWDAEAQMVRTTPPPA